MKHCCFSFVAHEIQDTAKWILLKVSLNTLLLFFPLFYQTDILFVLRVLAELGIIDHPGAQPAVDWLRNRQMSNGHWRGASPFRQRTWKVLGSGDETNRWVSLHAAMVLDHI